MRSGRCFPAANRWSRQRLVWSMAWRSRPRSLVLALLGFNLGVEAMQLVVMVATIPWLAIAASAPIYRAVRIAGAVFGGCAALGWIVERALGWHTPVPGLVEAVAAHGGWIILGLAALASATLVQSWQRHKAGAAPQIAAAR